MDTIIPQTLWSQTLPLQITHASTPSVPPLVLAVPRFSYLALLSSRLAMYFGRPSSSFHHEGVLLRNLPIGLLADLYRPQLPWRLVIDEGDAWDISDTFLNGVKEADFIRNGNANQIMKMSKDHTTGLWDAVKDNDYQSFARVNAILLNVPTPLKNVPVRIYIPSSPLPTEDREAAAASFKTLQALLPAVLPSTRQPNTLGAALRTLLPSLFPGPGAPSLATVVLHGAEVPFAAPLAELMREAAYPDGWLYLVVVLL